MMSNIPFDQLPLFFEGNSRILRCTNDPLILIGKLKPTLFSLKDKGPIVIPGIDLVRSRMNEILCTVLHEQGIKTSTIATQGEYIVMKKQEVAPIEVVVKGALVGSPKHIYHGIDQTLTRFNTTLSGPHAPYVRFDWRNPLPLEDQCMPNALANYFIDTEKATETAVHAFSILKSYFQKHHLDLLDICFFMNIAGDVICGEVSTDNCRLKYTGNDPAYSILSSKDKTTGLERAQTILYLLEHTS